MKLVEEVGTINNNLDLLTQKLAVARETREELIKNKADLKKDIDVKNNTIKIDKQKCMEIRQFFLWDIIFLYLHQIIFDISANVTVSLAF